MASVEPEQISLSMNGQRYFYDPDVLLPLLDLLQQHPLFAPETWNIDDRTNRPYDHESVASLASGKPSPYMLQLKRGKRVKHTTMVRFSNRPGMSVEIAPKTPHKDWQQLFELADVLTASYQPDIAWTHVFSDLNPPFDDDIDDTKYMMDSGVAGIALTYADDGPGGLGLRTYLGPRLIELFGRDLLLATPAVVTELGWGGIRIDLVEEPWQACLEDLTMAWQNAMDHLRPAGVFSEVQRDEDGEVYFKRGERFHKG